MTDNSLGSEVKSAEWVEEIYLNCLPSVYSILNALLGLGTYQKCINSKIYYFSESPLSVIAQLSGHIF